ncbi:uncharacterized protein LOC114519377 [Dendronephthya gigantea]|uniref:uncharacterized protein LOC114519377 n=1 Tax=Dendronephthya gigantea TaxID=151771 RepID=UPI00106B7599|nr:uncharacterized protein LOC114519377 [Dendronephthya gigantea]
MKEKVVIIIEDDSDESTVYNVREDGVIEISDAEEKNMCQGNCTSINTNQLVQPSSSNENKPWINHFNRKNVKSLPPDRIESKPSTSTSPAILNTPQFTEGKRSILTDKNSSNHSFSATNNNGNLSVAMANHKDIPCTAKSRSYCVNGSLKRKNCSNNPDSQPKRHCTEQANSYTSETNLAAAQHILFIDLDNWGRFLSLPHPLHPKLFVLGFCGGDYTEKKSSWSRHLRKLMEEKRFYKHPKCGKGKNAADIALCIHAGRLDLQLPKHIPFTVLSGDRDFRELKEQLSLFQRQVNLIDPHQEDETKLYKTLSMIGRN